MKMVQSPVRGNDSQKIVHHKTSEVCGNYSVVIANTMTMWSLLSYL